MRFFRNGWAVLFVVSASSSAWADENGLPQFDTALFPEQLFWLAVSFGMLYLLMSRVALPRVAATQDYRRTMIGAEISAARAAHETAKTTAAEADKVMAVARANAQASVSEMMAEIAEDTAKKQADQERDLQRRLHRAEQEIAVARQAAMDSIGAHAAELAQSIIDNIIKGRAGA